MTAEADKTMLTSNAKPAGAGIRYPHASTEPLEVIRANECEPLDSSLATARFQALWNEIERLTRERDEFKAKCPCCLTAKDVLELQAERDRLRAALTAAFPCIEMAIEAQSHGSQQAHFHKILVQADEALRSAAPAQPEGAADRPITGKQHEGDCWDAQEQIDRLRAALADVIRVADRKTAEFDAAREALTGSPASQHHETPERHCATCGGRDGLHQNGCTVVDVLRTPSGESSPSETTRELVAQRPQGSASESPTPSSEVRDAARYRWLRDNCLNDYARHEQLLVDLATYHWNPAEVDQKVDSVMALHVKATGEG